MRVKHHKCGSVNCGPLTEGCEHCLEGGKMVLFVTGRCDTGCYYCPVSLEKKGRDVVYANETKVSDVDDIIAEAESIDATGTGITGGDPLMNMDRTLRMISLLKGHFGKDHHIHLYTSTMDPALVKELRDAGLDEIRFHPSEKIWGSMDSTPLKEIARIEDIDIGIEVPALPGTDDDLDALMTFAENAGIGFVNLNELEFSESNWSMMDDKGYDIKDELSSAVKGSEELAMRMIRSHPKMRIHYCSSSFKDGVQLRNRLIRRANHIAGEYDAVTEDGTIIRGLLYADDLEAAESMLKSEYDVPDELMCKEPERGYIIVASWVLEDIAEELPYKCYIVEEYPTADRMEVERSPLN